MEERVSQAQLESKHVRGGSPQRTQSVCQATVHEVTRHSEIARKGVSARWLLLFFSGTHALAYQTDPNIESELLL